MDTSTHTAPYKLAVGGKLSARDISVDCDILLQEKVATANGEVTPDNGCDGLSKVIVDVPSSGTPAFTNITTDNRIDMSGANVTVGSTVYYVTGVTVNGSKTGGAIKTLTVTPNAYGRVVVGSSATPNVGQVIVNGGDTDKGVIIKPNRLVVVDGQTVTYTATTTVTVGSGEQVYSAGDLKVPVYSPTSSALVFPSGFATATSTTTMTVTGQITSINGAQIKDTSSNIVKGSSTLFSDATYTSYLAKFTGANTVAAGPKVEITTVTPTSTVGYRNGDIVFVVQ